jgi:hypothetical protein
MTSWAGKARSTGMITCLNKEQVTSKRVYSTIVMAGVTKTLLWFPARSTT